MRNTKIYHPTRSVTKNTAPAALTELSVPFLHRVPGETHNLKPLGRLNVQLREMPVAARKQAEPGHDRRKENHIHDVRPQRADHKHKCRDRHEDQRERCNFTYARQFWGSGLLADAGTYRMRRGSRDSLGSPGHRMMQRGRMV